MNDINEMETPSGILFKKAQSAILALLYGHTDEAFYLRQIERLTGLGIGPVQREVKHLTDAGIISRSIQGKQIYYRANANCPIFEELKGIVRKTFGVADAIRNALAPLGGKIRVAFIFGSVAASHDDRASDIDVMIIGRLTFSDAVEAISPAQQTLRMEINPVVYPTAEFKKRVSEKHHFIMNVLDGQKIFVKGDEDELARLAGR